MIYNKKVRELKPLVHCITNYVTVNDVANIILACGGSPIMADDLKEVSEITSISQALVINIGTLNQRTIPAMLQAGKTANEKGIPVILDPVGVGASTLRNETVSKLLTHLHFQVIRGNLSELSYIAGLEASTRGVDSANEVYDPIQVAQMVASQYHCVAAITGAVDIVTDGKHTTQIKNGVPQMSMITGTGCMLSGVIGAYIGAYPMDIYHAVVKAIISMGLAGEISNQKNGHLGTGSLHIGIIDAMSLINDELLEKGGKFNEIN